MQSVFTISHFNLAPMIRWFGLMCRTQYWAGIARLGCLTYTEITNWMVSFCTTISISSHFYQCGCYSTCNVPPIITFNWGIFTLKLKINMWTSIPKQKLAVQWQTFQVGSPRNWVALDFQSVLPPYNSKQLQKYRGYLWHAWSKIAYSLIWNQCCLLTSSIFPSPDLPIITILTRIISS